jgi:hypothetical protein
VQPVAIGTGWTPTPSTTRDRSPVPNAHVHPNAHVWVAFEVFDDGSLTRSWSTR